MCFLIPTGLPSREGGPVGWTFRSGLLTICQAGTCEHLLALMPGLQWLGSDMTDFPFPSGRPQTVSEDFQEQG